MILGAGKDIVVGVKAAPAPVAALPFDEQIFFVRNGAKLIRTGAVVKMAQQHAFGPAYLLVSGDGFILIDKGADAVWQKADLAPEQISSRGRWIEQLLGLAETAGCPFAYYCIVRDEGQDDDVFAGKFMSVVGLIVKLV